MVGKNEMVTCPYDRSHTLAYRNIRKHVSTCGSARGRDYEVCKYNATHYVIKSEMAAHLSKCKSKIAFHQNDECTEPTPGLVAHTQGEASDRSPAYTGGESWALAAETSLPVGLSSPAAAASIDFSGMTPAQKKNTKRKLAKRRQQQAEGSASSAPEAEETSIGQDVAPGLSPQSVLSGNQHWEEYDETGGWNEKSNNKIVEVTPTADETFSGLLYKGQGPWKGPGDIDDDWGVSVSAATQQMVNLSVAAAPDVFPSLGLGAPAPACAVTPTTRPAGSWGTQAPRRPPQGQPMGARPVGARSPQEQPMGAGPPQGQAGTRPTRARPAGAQ